MTTHEIHAVPVKIGERARRRRLIARIACAFGLIAVLCLTVAWWPAGGDPQLLWNEALRELQAGNIAAAEARFAAIHRLRDPTGLDHCLRAQIAVAGGRLDEALASLEQVPQDDPVAGQALLLTGRIQRQRNLTRKAEAAFRKAIQADPRLIDAHRELIYLLGMQIRRHEVDAEFKKLAQLTTLTHHELYTWGLSHFNYLQSVGARDTADHLQAFITADPEDRHSRLALASTLLKSPQMERVVESALEPLPRTDPEVMALKIELRLEHGQIDDALKILQDAPEGGPRLSRIRGRVALMRGDQEAAIRHFRAALGDELYDRVSLSELGRLLTLRGDSAAAEPYLAQAKRLDELYYLLNRIRRPDRENEPGDLMKLGKTCEAAGLLDEARGWYQLAISRDPFDSEAQKSLYRLKQTSPPSKADS